MALTKQLKLSTALVCVSLCFSAAASSIESQRSAFRDAYAKARAGDASVLRDYQSSLKDYPLWPDVISASYLGRLKSTSAGAIEDHLARYPDTSLNITLRYRYTMHLADSGADRAFLRMVDTHYRDGSDTDMACRAGEARLRGHTNKVTVAAALALWMVANSQPKTCDKLFTMLKDGGHLTPERHAERMYLALNKGRIDLARFLARGVPAQDRKWLDHWVALRASPERELRALARLRGDQHPRNDLYIYGVRRVARSDAAKARQLLSETHGSRLLDSKELDNLNAYIALHGARQRVAGASTWVDMVAAPSQELAEWRVRAALNDRDWSGVLQAIAALDTKVAAKPAWRYWQARALEVNGNIEAARGLYDTLAEDRSYYGFLAADRSQRGYQFGHKSVAQDAAAAMTLAAEPSLVRARELYEVGLFGPARSEWDRALAERDSASKRQAALLADSWGWHSASIRTLARSAGGDDLMRFYPTPYKKYFAETTQKADIARTWAYGITRSESLFMSDVKSSAGAIGLMQLIPRTGRETARRAKLPYRGTQTLLDPQQNIRLGVHYLGQMYSRFGENQVLATAAYNAGPTRVKSWLPGEQAVAADIWVETIPYTETRNYVKKVLFSDAMFHWRLTGTERRLAALMPPIEAPGRRKVASK